MAPHLYERSDGLRYFLEQRFLNDPDQFPSDGIAYHERFKQTEDFLNEHVHPEVVVGATCAGDGLLNDHGKEHVAMVIKRAELLLDEAVSKLTGYELYLLLLASHFHDVGNILGREDHEKKITDVMNRLGDRLPLDTPTRVHISEIARAHGGKINDSRDTIEPLQPDDFLQGHKIRPRLLAAILRFSDEIADDHNRAARFLLDNGQVPSKNQLYHRYSRSLQSPARNADDLIFKFDISDRLLIDNQQTKEDTHSAGGIVSLYLYDEILARMVKCFAELRYCARFMFPLVSINRIRVAVNVYDGLCAVFSDGFTLAERGYPDDVRAKPLADLIEKPLGAVNGEDLKRALQDKWS